MPLFTHAFEKDDEVLKASEAVDRAVSERHVELEYDDFLSKLTCAKAIVLDTETTSLRGHVIQIGFVGIDNTNHFSCHSILMKYKKTTTMWCKHAEIVHGIKEKLLEEKGAEIEESISKIKKIFEIIERNNITVVCHNVSFDKSSLNRTFFDNGYEPPWTPDLKSYCTMQASKDIFGKKLKNEVLYKTLFGKDQQFGMTHNALTDSLITASSYLKMQEKSCCKKVDEVTNEFDFTDQKCKSLMELKDEDIFRNAVLHSFKNKEGGTPFTNYGDQD